MKVWVRTVVALLLGLGVLAAAAAAWFALDGASDRATAGAFAAAALTFFSCAGVIALRLARDASAKTR